MIDNELLFYVDFDGCITQPFKIWFPDNDKINCGKIISDHDSFAINLLKDRLVFISHDRRINENWCKERSLSFICVPKEKEKFQYLKEDFFRRTGKKNPKNNYIYIGDTLADFECLKNSKFGFIPFDASGLLKYKLYVNSSTVSHIKKLKTCGGHGVLEESVLILASMQILNIEKLLDYI